MTTSGINVHYAQKVKSIRTLAIVDSISEKFILRNDHKHAQDMGIGSGACAEYGTRSLWHCLILRSRLIGLDLLTEEGFYPHHPDMVPQQAAPRSTTKGSETSSKPCSLKLSYSHGMIWYYQLLKIWWTCTSEDLKGLEKEFKVCSGFNGRPMKKSQHGLVTCG